MDICVGIQDTMWHLHGLMIGADLCKVWMKVEIDIYVTRATPQYSVLTNKNASDSAPLAFTSAND